MNVLNTKPPCYERAAALFGLKEGDPIFFTYGDTIYNPGNATLTTDLLVHEQTHGEQQEMHPDVAAIWWERYCHDPEFRVEQEAEAYGAQYEFLCRQYKDRNKRARIMHVLAKALSGPMYGNCVSYQDAAEKIRTYAEHTGSDE